MTISVTVVYSPSPRQVHEWRLELEGDATVLDAIVASHLGERFPDQPVVTEGVGILGRKVKPDAPLRDGDRVEIYRQLLVDPKVARRERFRGQGARAAGLFAKRRPGTGPPQG